MKIIHESAHGTLCREPDREYRKKPGVSPSALAEGLLGRGEVDVTAIRLATQYKPPTRSQASQDAMDRGTLVHMLLLEPERLQSDVAVFGGSRRSGAEWEAAVAESEERRQLLMRQQDFDLCSRVAAAYRNHPYVGGFLTGTAAEVSMFTGDCGIPVRGKVDAVDIEGKRIIDIKTTESIGPDATSSTMKRLHYREKMALYRRWVAKVTETDASEWRCWNLFLSMDPERPAVRRMMIRNDALEWGELVMLQALRQYADAVNADKWPEVYAVDDFADVKPWECFEQEGNDDIDYD